MYTPNPTEEEVARVERVLTLGIHLARNAGKAVLPHKGLYQGPYLCIVGVAINHLNPINGYNLGVRDATKVAGPTRTVLHDIEQGFEGWHKGNPWHALGAKLAAACLEYNRKEGIR